MSIAIVRNISKYHLVKCKSFHKKSTVISLPSTHIISRPLCPKFTTTQLMSHTTDKQSDMEENPCKSRAAHDLSDMRRPYRDQDDGIEESKLASRDPIKLFEDWFQAVKSSNTVYEPNAFSISTCGSSGQPTSRMVLLKGFDQDGFRFFTHYSSQKGQDIESNNKVAMLFYWDSFNRQVRIEGSAKKLPEQVAVDYFSRRPQSSQVGAAISDQKSLIESRAALMEKYNKLKADLGDKAPEKPETWGGYLIRPEKFEFWQGNTNRVHDRIIFERKIDHSTARIDGSLIKEAENGWLMSRQLP